jgi:hypothetical protein
MIYIYRWKDSENGRVVTIDAFHQNHVIWRTKITLKNLNIFCKRQISIKLFYLYQRFEYRDNYFFKMKFVLTTFWRNGNDSKQPYWKSIKKTTCFYFLVQYTRKCINFNHLSHKSITLCVIYSKWKKNKYEESWGTNLIHPLARDVKDALLTRIRQLTADADSKSLIGVLLLVCHKAK